MSKQFITYKWAVAFLVALTLWVGPALAEDSKTISPLAGQGLRGDANYTAEELQELHDLEKLVSHFVEESEEHRTSVRKLIELKYNRKRQFAHDHYEAQILALEEEQRSLREKAIKRFEKFLDSYPDDERYTPDTMFRLSELYFERSYDEYLQERESYDETIDNWDPSSDAEEPPPPDFHYEPSISTMQRLIIEFPYYRLIDGAYYLLGYCLSEMGESEEAVGIYEQLLAASPVSRFGAEVWTRVGNYYFDQNELDKAEYAFKQVLDDKGSPYYDKALYKLAWTHYRKADPERSPQEFQRAVNSFVELLDFNESTKLEGNERGQDLRPESIQYIAISYADEQWGGTDNLLMYFRRIDERAYERDVLMALAGVYYDQTRYEESVKVLEIIQQRYPTHPGAPVAQNQIIDALERSREFEKAALARSDLNRDYVANTPWFEANKDDEDAIAQTKKLISKSLYSAALFYHSQAQKYRGSGKLELAMDSYQQAAKAYDGYLKRFPHDKQLYELTFYLAECLYYSTQFLDAAMAYTQVRDARADRKYRQDSALSVVLSYEKEALFAVKRGELNSFEVKGSSDRVEGDSVESKEIPGLRKNLITASDVYEKVVKGTDANLPGILYKAAEVFYGYDHFAEARRRFLDILKRFPGHETSVYASNLIIESYLSEKNFQAVEDFTRKLLEMKDGLVAQRGTFQGNLVKFKTGAMFKRAERLAEKGKLEEASALYVQLVDESPKAQFADLALNNAAVGYEKVKRYDSASKLYERIVKEYPRSSLADTALFRVALNAERFFDFDKAILTYKKLIKNYPKSESRPDAVYNGALALENTQQYSDSAVLYERYCKLFPNREDAPEVCFRAGAVYEKMNDLNRAVSTYQNFVRNYNSKTSHRDRISEAYLRIAKAYEKMGKERDAMKYFGKTVKEVAKSGDEKSAPYGAEAQFEMVERRFKDFSDLKITGGVKQQKKGLVKKLEALKSVEASYKEILKFKQLDWTLASLFRIGALYQNVAETFVNAPCPREIKRSARDLGMTGEEVCEEYVALLEEQAMSIEDKAVMAYEITINRAREFQIANQWTKKTLIALNKLRKSEWPLQKDAKFFLDTNAVETLQLLDAKGNRTEASTGEVENPSESDQSQAGVVPVVSSESEEEVGLKENAAGELKTEEDESGEEPIPETEESP